MPSAPGRRPTHAASIVAAAASALAAGLAGHPLQTTLAGVALAALLAWLSLYVRIATPINRELTQAAGHHEIPTNARAMQQRWDHIIARSRMQCAWRPTSRGRHLSPGAGPDVEERAAPVVQAGARNALDAPNPEVLREQDLAAGALVADPRAMPVEGDRA